MENLVALKIWQLRILGYQIEINIETVLYSWAVILFLIFSSLIIKRKFALIPTKIQFVIESLYLYFKSALEQSMGEKGKKFLPFILTLFLFILFSNWLSLIPHLKSPTRDLNTCLGLALLVFIIAHISAIKEKGLGKYIKGYFSPYWLFFPSNVFSEFSKTLSHAFRLFGNVFAGGAIIAILPILLAKGKWFALPIGYTLIPIINAFFVLFIGGIQAFVFAVLAMAYISILIE